jgi:enoyl-CoA hydratase/carnithine racemase
MQITRTGNLRVDRDGGLLRLTITCPARMNAIDLASMTEISDVLTETATDSSVRVVVLTGEGTAFCTGADLANGQRRALELTKAAVNAATLTELDAALERERSARSSCRPRPISSKVRRRC